mmetsp:Transcript_19436/g.54961  ORF Transcript_19436/g.54961 Transcript_19436/m.54961 type:complete len:95 (-) Transcript_19436:177-461(-)
MHTHKACSYDSCGLRLLGGAEIACNACGGRVNQNEGLSGSHAGTSITCDNTTDVGACATDFRGAVGADIGWNDHIGISQVDVSAEVRADEVLGA